MSTRLWGGVASNGMRILKCGGLGSNGERIWSIDAFRSRGWGDSEATEGVVDVDVSPLCLKGSVHGDIVD